MGWVCIIASAHRVKHTALPNGAGLIQSVGPKRQKGGGREDSLCPTARARPPVSSCPQPGLTPPLSWASGFWIGKLWDFSVFITVRAGPLE